MKPRMPGRAPQKPRQDRMGFNEAEAMKPRMPLIVAVDRPQSAPLQ